MAKYAFLRTIDLDGKRASYQLPNDLNDIVLNEYLSDKGTVKEVYKRALITVPAARYDKDGNVKLKVVLITGVYVAEKKIYWRCRGQFVPYIRWSNSLESVKGCFNYMNHDYKKINQARIRRDLLKWYKNYKMDKLR